MYELEGGSESVKETERIPQVSFDPIHRTLLYNGAGTSTLYYAV